MTNTQQPPHSGEDGPADRGLIDSRYGPVSQIFAALASPLRAAIVHLLTERERSVAELVEALGVAQPLVSQHLGRLRAAGLVDGRREGKQVIYNVADQHVAHVFLDALQHSSEGQHGAEGAH